MMMEGIGGFEQHSSKEAIPRYDRYGCLYTEEQRKLLADKRGVCVRCGMTTYERRGLFKKAISNENVYEGICIRCNPHKVPADILYVWEARHRQGVVVVPPTPAAETAAGPLDTSNRSRGRGSGESSNTRSNSQQRHRRSGSSGSIGGGGGNSTNTSGARQSLMSSNNSNSSSNSRSILDTLFQPPHHGNNRTKHTSSTTGPQQHQNLLQAAARRTMRAVSPKHAQYQGHNSWPIPPSKGGGIDQAHQDTQESIPHNSNRTNSSQQDSGGGSGGSGRTTIRRYSSDHPAADDNSASNSHNNHEASSSSLGSNVTWSTKTSVEGDNGSSSRFLIDSNRSLSIANSNGGSRRQESGNYFVVDGNEDRSNTVGAPNKRAPRPRSLSNSRANFGNNNEASDNSTTTNTVTTPMTAVENEKAMLGIFRPAPATRPGVESYTRSASSSDHVEAFPTIQTTASADFHQSYTNSPRARSSIVPSSSVARVLPTANSDPILKGTRSTDDDDRSINTAPTAPRISGPGDLRLSLRDDYRGDEIKQPTLEYMNQLADNLDDPNMLRRVLHNLRNIEDDDQHEVLHQIKVILSHCSSDPRVGDVALGVIWRTSAVSLDAKFEVMQSGAIDVVLDCLRKQSDDAEFCQWALGVLTSVAFHMENKELLGDKGGIELVLDVLFQQKKNAGVFEWGCRCLHNLVHCYQESTGRMDRTVLSKNITSIEEAGGIEIVLDAMSLNITENNAQLWAIKLLWRLLDASGASDSMRRLSVMHRIVVIRKMAAADFVIIASKLLRQQSTSGELLVYTAELMTVVILGAGGEASMFKYAVLLEKASQCASSMIRAIEQMPDELDVQAAGCRLLSALCNAKGTILVDMLEHGAIDVLASSMLKLQQDESIVEPGTWALWKLSAELKGQNGGTMEVELSSIHQALATVGRLFVKHSKRTIRRAINGFLANICGTAGLELSDFPLASLASSFLVDPLAGAGDVLILLSSEYPQSSELLLRSLNLDNLVELLSSSQSTEPELLGLVAPVLVSVAESSTVARNLMLEAGILPAAFTALESCQDKNQRLSMIDLISAVSSCSSTTQEHNDETMAPVLPRGLCRTIRSCLDKGFSDEMCSAKLIDMAVGIIVQSSTTDDLDLLLPWVVDQVSGSNVSAHISACNLLWAISVKRSIRDKSQLRNLLLSVLDLMLKYKGESRQDVFIEVQSAAAGALSGIAASIRNNPVLLETKQIDSLMGVVYKSRPLGNEAILFNASILVFIWNLSFVHEAVLLQAGVIILVIDIMGAFRQSALIQEKGCLVLAQLASSETIQVCLSIVETDGIHTLFEALDSFPSNIGIHREAARALAHLSTDDETRMLVSAMGGISVLSRSIFSFNNDLVLLERAYSAVLNLTSDVPEQFLDLPTIVRAVVTTMAMYPQSTSLRENGLGILQNVCMKGNNAKETIAAEGGITTVTSAMENFITTPTILERAFSTLWSLAILPVNRSRIADANGIRMVVVGMYASIEYERVQQQGCGCMFTLSSDARNRLAFRQEGGVEAITLSSKAHFSSLVVQLEACRCLAGLSTPGDGSEQISSISQDEVNAILVAMQRFFNSEGVQVHGCTALCNFLYARNAATVVAKNRDLMSDAVERASRLFYSQCKEVALAFHQRLLEFSS